MYVAEIRKRTAELISGPESSDAAVIAARQQQQLLATDIEATLDEYDRIELVVAGEHKRQCELRVAAIELFSVLETVRVPYPVFELSCAFTAWKCIFDYVPTCRLYGVMTLVCKSFHEHITSAFVPQTIMCSFVNNRLCLHNVVRAIRRSNDQLMSLNLFSMRNYEWHNAYGQMFSSSDLIEMCTAINAKRWPRLVEASLPMSRFNALTAGVVQSLTRAAPNIEHMAFGHHSMKGGPGPFTPIIMPKLRVLHIAQCSSDYYDPINISGPALTTMAYSTNFFCERTTSVANIITILRRTGSLLTTIKYLHLDSTTPRGHRQPRNVQPRLLMPAIETVTVIMDTITFSASHLDGVMHHHCLSFVEEKAKNVRVYRRDWARMDAILAFVFTTKTALRAWVYSYQCRFSGKATNTEIIAAMQAPAFALRTLARELA